MLMNKTTIAALLLCGFATAMADTPNAQSYANGVNYRGVNLAGGAFAGTDGNSAKGMFLPTLDDAKLFLYRGMNTYRIPISWEYIADINGALKSDASATQYIAKLTQVINDLTAKGAYVVLDLHNYMRYNTSDINKNVSDTDPNGSDVIGVGSAAPTTQAYAALWQNLVTKFHSPKMIYDLMNEPHDVSNDTVVKNYNAALLAIRNEEQSQGVTSPHLVLIEGNSWSGMHSWMSSGNSAVFPSKIVDPQNNFAIELHQYFDYDASGTYQSPNQDCISLDQFKNGYSYNGQAYPGFDTYWPQLSKWAKDNHVKLFLGEFGSPDTATCRADLNAMMTTLSNDPATNDSGFMGWTVWAAGGHWGNYVNSIAPGGPANGLMFNNALYQNFLTQMADLPGLGYQIASLTNNSSQPLIFSSGNLPFQQPGSATLAPGQTAYLYSSDSSLSPSSQVELSYHVQSDPTNVIGFGVTANGYGYSYGDTGGVKITNSASCGIKPADGDTKRCFVAQ